VENRFVRTLKKKLLNLRAENHFRLEISNLRTNFTTEKQTTNRQQGLSALAEQ
jgi:hypothetical protein